MNGFKISSAPKYTTRKLIPKRMFSEEHNIDDHLKPFDISNARRSNQIDRPNIHQTQSRHAASYIHRYRVV